MKRTMCIVVAITIGCMIAVFAGSDHDTKIGAQNPQSETSSTAVPEEINYQGVLTDPTGTVVPDNTYNITFRLYTAATGGTQLWSGSQSVATHGGLFNVLLPIPASHFDGSDRWLGVEVNNDGEMSPRQQMVSVPYAYLSGDGGGAGDGHSLDAADGDPVDALYVDDDGNVGIGTKTPQGHLHVGEGTFVVTKPDNDVGIGTATPQAKLDVNGSVYFEGGSGDVSGDGMVDNIDLLGVTNYLIGAAVLTKHQYAEADIDGDGRVIVDDLAMIANLILGFSKDEATRKVHTLYGVDLNSFFVNGDASISGDLYVDGAIVTPSVEDVRIIRGSINADGSIAAGTGFTVAKAGAGRYDVTFNTAYPETPTVTATYKVTNSMTSRMAMVTNKGTASVRVVVTNAGGTSAVDGDCEFIAVGPR